MIYIILIILMAIANRKRGDENNAWIGRTLGTFIIIYLCNLSGSSLTLSIISGILYHILSIALGWGKWVGAITGRKEDYHIERNQGKWNGIHQIGNYFYKEVEEYKKYSILCLSLCGFYWFLPVSLCFSNNFCIKIIVSALLGISFPISMYLGTLVLKLYKDKILFSKRLENIISNWELGEIIYGGIQGILLYQLLINLF